MSMFACITKWWCLQRTMKIVISLISFKSFLRNLAPVKCINILKHTKFSKFLRFSLTQHVYKRATYAKQLEYLKCNKCIMADVQLSYALIQHTPIASHY